MRRIREVEAAVQQAIDAAVARAAAKLGALAGVADGGGETGPCGASMDGGSRGLTADRCQEKSTERLDGEAPEGDR